MADPVAPAQSNSVIPQEALFKNRLQEYAQKAAIPLPVYHTINEGTPHAPMFRSTVVINGATYTSPNVFLHRKTAEMDAARIALPNLTPQIDKENCSLDQDSSLTLEDNFICKSILNEYAVKIHAGNPIYETNTSNGQPPTFVSSVAVGNKHYVGDVGGNKKESLQLAARAAILSILDSDARAVISNIINSKKRLYAVKGKVKHPCDAQNEVMPLKIQTECNVGTSASASKGNEPNLLPDDVVPNDNMPRALIPEHYTENFAHFSSKPAPLDEFRSPELKVSLAQGLEANGSPIILVPPNLEQRVVDSTTTKKRKRRSKKAKNKVGIDAHRVQIAVVPSSVVVNDSMPETTNSEPCIENYTSVQAEHVPLNKFSLLLPGEKTSLDEDQNTPTKTSLPPNSKELVVESISVKRKKPRAKKAKNKVGIKTHVQNAAEPSSQTTICTVARSVPNNCVSLQGFDNAVLSGPCVLPKGGSGSETHILVFWRKPPEGFIALNTHGALQSGIAAGGGVLRNQFGEHISNFYNNYGRVSIDFAQSKAILDGLSVCKELGYNKIQIQTDSAEAALWFHRQLTVTVPLGLQDIWNEIYKYQDALSIEILHVYKEGNRLAELLSKKGILSEGMGSINISLETSARYCLTADKMGMSYLRKLTN